MRGDVANGPCTIGPRWWNAVKDGVALAARRRTSVGAWQRSQPRARAAATLRVWSALSGGQEMPTVSAVSLTANEFPGGGDTVCVCVCLWVLEQVGWQLI